MSSKIRIRLGEIEIEYEGPEEFLKEELPELLKAVAALHTTQPAPRTGAATSSPAEGSGADSVSTIARRLAISTGPDLIVASALALTLRGVTVFTKKQLRDEMKSATGFYQDTYRSNFDSYLKRLVKAGRVDHTGGANFSLPETERTALAARLT